MPGLSHLCWLTKWLSNNPEPVYIERQPYLITYGYYQRDSSGRIVDPICIRDTMPCNTVENYGYYNSEDFISQFDVIDLNNWEPTKTLEQKSTGPVFSKDLPDDVQSYYGEEDDLPF